MQQFTDNKPLTEAELDRLQEFLDGFPDGRAMNIEELDGFLSALAAGPDLVPPSVFMPEVLGGPTEEVEFESEEEADEFLTLVLRHWNHIESSLANEGLHLPLLLEGEGGVPQGNDWADGFLCGTHLTHDAWTELLNDEDRGGCMIPMLALHHEHDEDPEMRPGPVPPEKREEIIALMAAGLTAAYRYFKERRRPEHGEGTAHASRARARVGRNDPCPCGSGKKYKRCCGGATLQ